MSLSASSSDAAGLVGEAAGGEMAADTALDLAVVRLDPDRLACPNVHHIPALESHVRFGMSRTFSSKPNTSVWGSLPSCSI